jgi:hypothetical protein
MTDLWEPEDNNPFMQVLLEAPNNDDTSIYVGCETPGEWTQQTTDFTCAVVSQKMVLDAFNVVDSHGAPLSEAALVYEATANGWLTDGGTSPLDVGRLLELHGISTHQGQGMENLVGELAHGHKAIVGVDANELWQSDHPIINEIKDWFGPTPNHALVVEGVRVDENGQPFVVVNDPGDPNGSGREYPLEDFQDAFADSGCFYVATDEAPSNLVDDEVLGRGFDPSSGIYDGSDSWLARVGAALSTRAVAAAVIRGLAGASVALGTLETLKDAERKRLLCNL